MMTEKKLKVKQELLSAKDRLILAEFSNGIVKSSSSSQLKFKTYQGSKNEQNNLNRFLVASNNRLQYAGSNFELQTSKITSSVLKVAVMKKSTRKLKLYDVDLFHLKPVLACQPIIKSSIEESWVEQTRNLSLEFGSKYKKRSIVSKQNNESTICDSTSYANHKLEFDTTNITDAKQAPEAIPTQNKSATTVEEVYNIHEIIPESDYSSLDAEANVFVSATLEDIQLWKSSDRYCPFILTYAENKCKSISFHNAKILCYLHYMICFIRTTYKDWRKKDPVPEVPQPFKKSLMNRYVLKKSLPQRMKDKIIAEALVLALTINNYVIDGKVLALSTGVSLQKITLIAYVLGCHVSAMKNEETKMIQLKLPLYKYEPRSFKRKK